MTKLFLVINEGRFFLSHRKEIALEAKQHGYDVTIVTKNNGNFGTIKGMGLNVIDLPINPLGMNLKEEFCTHRFLMSLYRRERPDIVHHVGMKTILWGGLAAKLTQIKGVVNAVSGLGTLFNGPKLTMMTRGILMVMRFSNSRHGVKVIFQNDDDKTLFLNHKVVHQDQIEFIKGSGIDLLKFTYTKEPTDGKIKILFTGRMVKEKGVCDLIEAAKLLKPEMEGKVSFLLCGRLTEKSNAISKEYLEHECDGEYLCYLGERSDVKKLLEQSHIMAFPSYYREGVPKSLIEASAIGRPIVTCDSIGCKDVVIDGENGFLIEPRNPEMLADRLRKLINNTELRENMGINARKKAEKEFSVDTVVATHMKIYQELSK